MKKFFNILFLIIIILSLTSCKKAHLPETIEETENIFNELESQFNDFDINFFDTRIIEEVSDDWQYIPNGAKLKVHCMTIFNQDLYAVYFGKDINENSINEFKILTIKETFGNIYDDYLDEMLNGNFTSVIKKNENIEVLNNLKLVAIDGWIYFGDELLVSYFEGRISASKCAKRTLAKFYIKEFIDKLR